MKKEFTLKDGRTGVIEMPKDLVEQMGEELAEQMLDQAIANYKKKIEESQE
jgi:hypothetical protein